jgi:hypothetical protein
MIYGMIPCDQTSSRKGGREMRGTPMIEAFWGEVFWRKAFWGEVFWGDILALLIQSPCFTMFRMAFKGDNLLLALL